MGIPENVLEDLNMTKSAVELANIGIFYCFLEKEEIYSNEQFRTDFNITSVEPHQTYNEFLKNIPENIRKGFICNMQDAKTSSTIYVMGEQMGNIIIPVIYKNGTTKYIQLITSVKEWDLENNKITLSGICKDCTCEEQKSQELKLLHLKSQKILELIPDTVMVMSHNLLIEDILSHKQDKFINKNIIGKNLADYVYEPYNQKHVQELQEIVNMVIKTNNHHQFKTTLMIKGSMEHFLCDLTPYTNNLVILFLQNTTEIENAQKKLEENQTLLGYALNVANVKAFFFNFPSENTGNEAILSFYGLYASDPMKTKTYTWSQFKSQIHPDDIELNEKTYQKLIRQEINKIKLEFRFCEDSDKYTWFEFTGAVREISPEGHPVNMVGCYVNIQNRKEHEENLIRAREKAELADKMKSTYLANMSHEIRTPLNAIVGFSELLSFADDAEEKQSYIDIIKANNDQLLHLIADIIDVSKIEAGILSVNYQRIDLNELMDEIYHTIRLKIKEGINFFVEKGEISYIFNIDKNRLNQVITNLLNNAIKFTETGKIYFGYKLQPQGIYFYVSDTGSGIPAEKLENIFARHVMLNRKKEGFGLGLAISKGIVEKFGGDLLVESTEGEGSTFSFIIPV